MFSHVVYDTTLRYNLVILVEDGNTLVYKEGMFK